MTHVSYMLAMTRLWLWTRSQWPSLTISKLLLIIHCWRWIDRGFDIAYSQPFPLQPEQWLHERLLKTDSWPELSFEHLQTSGAHTKRLMWFHKGLPMLISFTEIPLVSVTHPYPYSMCSFKPRNGGDEKHVQSYPVQSNQYHCLVHASTAQCCHMNFIPPKIVIDSIIFLRFFGFAFSNSACSIFMSSCRAPCFGNPSKRHPRYRSPPWSHVAEHERKELCRARFVSSHFFSTCGLEWLCVNLCLSNQTRQFSLSNPVWNTFMSELLEIQRKFLKSLCGQSHSIHQASQLLGARQICSVYCTHMRTPPHVYNSHSFTPCILYIIVCAACEGPATAVHGNPTLARSF